MSSQGVGPCLILPLLFHFLQPHPGSCLQFSFFYFFQCVATRGVVAWSSKAWKALNSEAEVGQLASMSFKKTRSDTYLRLTWSSTMRQMNHNKCSQWYFMINGRECTSPAPINGIIFQFYHNGGSSSQVNDHRHTTIVGVCKATSSGDLQSASYQISMNIKDCPSYSGTEAYTGWQTTSSMIIEELCPPQ